MKKKDELITVNEAADILDCSTTTIHTKIKKGIFHSEKQGITKVYRQEILEYKADVEQQDRNIPFGDIILEFNESCKILDTFNASNTIGNPMKYVTDTKYLVTNKGRIINCVTNNVLTQKLNTKGYYHVGVRICKTTVTAMVHKLVALMWCPNGKYKGEIHHINGVRTDNNADNLIWMTPKEHGEAHRLMNSGKKKEYKKFISAIRKDNKWKEKIRVIPHLDYEQNENYFYYMYISETAYNKYKDKKSWDEVPLSEIKAEYAVFKYE